MQYKIKSEIGPLRFVITHRPGIEHEYVTPKNLIEKIENNNSLIDNPDYLLFDDIIQTKKAQNEHYKLYEILHHFTGGNCYEFIDILKIVLSNEKVRNLLINECIELEDDLYNHSINSDQLNHFSMPHTLLVL